MPVSLVDHASPLADAEVAAALASLQRWFGVCFTLLEPKQSLVLESESNQPAIDWSRFAERLQLVSQGQRAAIIEEEDPLIVVAIPLQTRTTTLVAASVFLTRRVEVSADLTRATEVFGIVPKHALAWAKTSGTMVPSNLECLCDLACDKLAADARIRQLQNEAEQLNGQISSTYEEISLIYRLTQNLKLSGDKEDLGRVALQWLIDTASASGVALYFVPAESDLPAAGEEPVEPQYLAHGNVPLDARAFQRMVEHLDLDGHSRPVVLNNPTSADSRWPFPTVQQLVLVPVAEGHRVFGYLAAFNHVASQEFSTREASLLSSVGTILGIHSSNLDLYREQAGVLANIVRAMSSAIDAKDPYTRGHSDRVARVAVCLAQELGCDQETLKTLYLAGLLHDIGKIGIDDNVLRKPGKLTEAEYEHVKTHAEIGYRILKDLPKMGHMLPVVLHHHEAWDGTGYPYGLTGKNIPFLARVAAVADAYDAMASDRPYRPGMSEEKLDDIIRAGAGKQWDPDVVAAYFRVRDEIRQISASDAGPKAEFQLDFS